MGWATGSYLAEDIWKMVKDYLPEEKRTEIAEKIYNIFCDQDADDWYDQDVYLTALPCECKECGARMSKEDFKGSGLCRYCYRNKPTN